MEKYSSSCRLILICNNSSKVIDPVRSRCLGIRVAAPSHDEVAAVLKTVSRKENITLPDELAINIARASNRNLRRALLMLESCHVTTRDDSPKVLKANTPIPHTDWEKYIAMLAAGIASEQSPKALMAAREKLYELLINCIPAQVILKTLVMELLPKLDDTVKGQVVQWAAFYEHRIALGSKEIFVSCSIDITLLFMHNSNTNTYRILASRSLHCQVHGNLQEIPQRHVWLGRLTVTTNHIEEAQAKIVSFC